MSLRALFRVSIGCVVLCHAQAAQAWLFPEHMEITRLAYERDLPSEARAEIDRVIDEARTLGLQLCREIPPLEQYSQANLKCVPYSALPALAGDHANHIGELEESLRERRVPARRVSALYAKHTSQKVASKARVKPPSATKILKLVAEHWSDYLTTRAPGEVQRLYRSRAWQMDSWQPSWVNGNAQRVFTRELDIALRATDSRYATRAGETRAHFQDSLTPIPDLLAQLKSRGNIDNALAQVLAHHIRSLQLASFDYPNAKERAAGRTQALLEHANALHFLQDAFASGHLGTEHRVPVNIEKARRHDFLNRSGLNVQRAVLGARCENITAAGRNAAESSEPTRAGCWVAFGDGYLDGYNGRIVSHAVAQLQLQFAMALGKTRADLATNWLRSCRPQAGDARPIVVKGEDMWMWPAGVEEDATELTPSVRFEGEGLAHVHRVQFEVKDTTLKCHVGMAEKEQTTIPCERGDLTASLSNKQPLLVRVSVASHDFDPQITVRKCPDKACRQPTKVASNSDVTPFDVQASVTFPIQTDTERTEIYELVVGNDGRTPRESGEQYRVALSIEPARPDVGTDSAAESCDTLLRAAELLDPAPEWTQTADERKRRAEWSSDTRYVWAHYIVESARDALGEVQRLYKAEIERGYKPPLLSASGSASGAVADIRIEEVLGNPLEPCVESPTWKLRGHPFCSASTRGTAFAFGQPHASLWRPLIAIWPTPMGDITLIEGKDAFGEGPAVQVVFGGGPAMQLGEEYNWALSAWLGVGVSYRVNNLFPARENRSLFELNVAVQPVVTTIEDSRFLLAGFFEARFPLVPFLFAWFLGETSWFEWGPLGVRYYFVWPNKLPGGPGQWDVGWDVELLNFDIDRATARNREAGHLLDKEIRIRLGYFNQQYLMGSEGSGRSWVLAAEFAWGHSTYFGDF